MIVHLIPPREIGIKRNISKDWPVFLAKESLSWDDDPTSKLGLEAEIRTLDRAFSWVSGSWLRASGLRASLFTYRILLKLVKSLIIASSETITI